MSETHEANRSIWKGLTEYFAESFHLNDYSKILHPEKPLPHWDSSVVEEFVASDPIHGPTVLGWVVLPPIVLLVFGISVIVASFDRVIGLKLKSAREAAKYGLVGAGVGAVLTGGNAWRWSKSPHGAALSFAFGGVVGFTLGAEFANHWCQLSRPDTLAAQAKFFEWLQKRA